MVHLHARSWFSFGAGAASPASLAREAARRGQSALALTDRNTLAGAVRHASACDAAGIDAIFGATVTVIDPVAGDVTVDTAPDTAPLILLCGSSEGYANLCDLLTLAHLRAANMGDRAQPRLHFEELREHAEGLFCLTGDHDGALSRLLEAGEWTRARKWVSRLKSGFGKRLLVELTHHERSGDNARLRQLIELSQTLNVPTVATNAARYATSAEYAVFDALTCMRLGLTVAQWHRERPRNARAYLCSDVRLLKRGLPAEAIANTEAMARECRVDLMPGHVTPPQTRLPEGLSARAFLQRLCVQGLGARGLSTSRAAKAQLRRSLGAR